MGKIFGNNKTEQENVDFLKDLAGDGYENLTQSDFKIPFLRILQEGSPQCKPEKPEYIEGAKPGYFFNTVTGELYGNSLLMIPVAMNTSWIEWKPNRGGFVAKHAPESINVQKLSFNNWVFNGNEIVETKEFLVLLPDHLSQGPMIFPLSSSGVKHAQAWNTLITNVKLPNGQQAPYYSSVWELRTTYINNPKGDYYQIGDKTSLIKRVRWITKNDYGNFIQPTRKNMNEITNTADYRQIEAPKNEVNTQNVPY